MVTKWKEQLFFNQIFGHWDFICAWEMVILIPPFSCQSWKKDHWVYSMFTENILLIIKYKPPFYSFIIHTFLLNNFSYWHIFHIDFSWFFYCTLGETLKWILYIHASYQLPNSPKKVTVVIILSSFNFHILSQLNISYILPIDLNLL